MAIGFQAQSISWLDLCSTHTLSLPRIAKLSKLSEVYTRVPRECQAVPLLLDDAAIFGARQDFSSATL